MPSTGRDPKLTISLLILSSLTGRDVLTPFPGLGTAAAPAQAGAHLKQCDLLKLSRRQKQLCRREPGLAETLRDAAHLGLLECQFQFRQERWNCSLEGRTGLLQRGGEDSREDFEGEEDKESQHEGREEEGWWGVVGGEMVTPSPHCADDLGTVPSEKRPGELVRSVEGQWFGRTEEQR